MCLLTSCATSVGRPATPAMPFGAAGRSGGASQAASPVDTPGETEPGEGEREVPIHGFVTTRFSSRSSGGSKDRDIYQTLSVDIGERGVEPVTWHFMANVAKNLEGKNRDGDDKTFYSLNDSKGRSLTARIYHAFADIHAPAESVERVRVGRQPLYDTPEPLHFDGILAETPRSVSGAPSYGAYLGVPVNEFESSSSGDSVVGLFMKASPWQSGELRLDWMHLEDESRLGDHVNDLLGVSSFHRVSAALALDARYSMLEGRSRDLHVGTRYVDPEGDLAVRAQYYELLTKQVDLVENLDPFSATLFDLRPYRQYSVLASKGLTPDVSLQGGVDVRRLSDDDDMGDNNREFDRVFATCTVADAGTEGLSVSATAETWDSSGNDIATWGLDLTQRLEQDLRLSVGSYFSIFKYSFDADEERDEVRTTYAGLRYGISEGTSVNMRYEFEQDDEADYRSFRIGVTCRF